MKKRSGTHRTAVGKPDQCVPVETTDNPGRPRKPVLLVWLEWNLSI